MKKLVYPLIAALILCLVGLGMLFAQRTADQRTISELHDRLEQLSLEKAQWDQDKQQVGKSLGSVRSLLVKTLVDLEDISTSIGVPMATDTPVPSPSPKVEPLPAPAEPAKPTPSPTPSSTPTPSPTPEAPPVDTVQASPSPLTTHTEKP